MTTDAHDPRISKILQLVSQLTDHPFIMNGETRDGDGDDIDCIVEMLTALVEELEDSKVSRNFLLNITDSMLDSMIITDLDGRITMVNKAACQLFGFQESELIAQPINHLFVQPFKIDDPDVHDLEERTVVAKDGRHIPVSCSRSQLRNHQGQPEGFICIAQDITERKQTEETLEMFQYSIDQATDAIIWLTYDAGFSYVNEQACRSLGYSREELMRLKLWDIDPVYPKERYAMLWEHWRENRQGGGEHLETLQRRKDGSLFPVEVSSKHLWFGDQELHVAVCRDITERKRAEEIFMESQTVLQSTMESMQDGLLVITEDGKVSHYNSSFCQMWAIPENLMAVGDDQTLIDHVLPQLAEPEQFAARIDEVYQTSAVSEDILHLRDGRLFERVSYPLIQGGQEKGRVWTFRDVTERTRAEEALRMNSFAVESMSDAVHWIAPDHRIVDVNEAACHMLGYARQELIGMSVADLDPMFSIDELDGFWERVKEEGAINFETVHKTKDGRILPVEIMANYITFEGKELTCCFVRDISQRKRAEEALLQSEERLRQAVRAGNIGIFDHDHTDDTIYWSPEHRRIYGLDLEERVTLPKYLEQIHPDDRERIKAAVQRAHDPAGDGNFDVEHRNIDRSGVIHWLSVRSHTFFDGEGSARRPVRTIGAVVDITERKRAEDELWESRHMLQLILDHMPSAVIWKDRNSVYMGCNRHQAILAGLESPQDLIGLTDYDLPNTAPESAAWYQQVDRRVMDSDTPELNFEELALSPNGPPRWLRTSKVPLHDASGAVIGVLVVFDDITETKQQDEALRKSEARFRALVENSPDYIVILDNQYRLQYINVLAEGFTMEQVIGKRAFDFLSAEYHGLVKATLDSVMQDGNPGQYEVQGHRRDGTIGWLHTRVVPILEAGQVTGITQIVTDITERKRIEDELRQSEARYRAVIESQVDLISRYRPDTILTFVNDAYCRFYGITREELIGHSFMMMIAPEFRELVKKETEEIAKKSTPVSGEYLNFGADGKARWIQWVIQPIVDENGQVVELQGVGRDVTRLKQTEAALRESEDLLQKSQTVGRIGSYYFDVRTGQWISSPMLDKIFGTDDSFVKDIEGWIALVHPEEKEEMLRYLHQHVLTEHNRFDKEYRIKRYDNRQELWVHGLGELEFDESGTPIKMIGTIQDITERKQMEEALRDSENRLSVIFNQSADLQALSSVEPDGTFRLVTINKRYLEAVQRNFGVSEQDIIGKTLIEVLRDVFGFEGAACSEVLNNYDHVVSSGQVFRYEETLDAPLGTFYAETVLVPIFEPSQTCRYILYSARDITERKRAEEKIRQLNEELEQRVIERTQELEEANEEIRHFAYIVSHDLRAPLVNLKGFAAELRSGLKMVEEGLDEVLPLVSPPQRDRMMYALQEDIPESLRFIESSVSNMDTFTKAILKLSRLGRLHLELVEVDVRSLVEKTLETLSYQINQRGVRVTIGDLPVVTADFVSMEQIFGNILTNAVVYVDPNRPGEIDISAERTADDIVFRIRDNGRGIAPEDMDKVFAPFRRAGKQDIAGEGMGLAYVQTLVRRHGGRIWCDSQAGVGTTFTFTIPRNLTNDTAGW